MAKEKTKQAGQLFQGYADLVFYSFFGNIQLFGDFSVFHLANTAELENLPATVG